ncbi:MULTISPECIES: hypothetical protein [unclassified Chelatococcus]|uniref:hypothetical protein n=1 Tax=unclassified Chelatococcus TaxID=2638111 RepID=UPI001BCF5255|nr:MULTISPECIES: hypothetical protein [unclassified Chelatococcus]MBS7698793.1 hypothetical protein [Chelatococcus sp. YT9]MBX3554625.1 hypothetical protein [Chelatococcus sp.]
MTNGLSVANMANSAPRMTSVELSELALDAAIEVENVIRGRAPGLDSVNHLISCLLNTITTGRGPSQHRMDLTYLPIYESALETISGERPDTVEDFAKNVRHVLAEFATPGNETGVLNALRDFCIAVHEEALSQRMDLIHNADPQSRYVANSR